MNSYYDHLNFKCKKCRYEVFSAKDISVCNDAKIELHLKCPECGTNLQALISHEPDRYTMAQTLGI